MIEWKKATSEPWLYISAVMALAIYRASKVIWQRLFSEKGIVPNFIDGIREDSKGMKESLVKYAETSTASFASLQGVVVKRMSGVEAAVNSLESQLVQAIQAKPEDGELFRVLFDDNPIPICFIGPDFRFTKVNDACAEFLGYSTGELANMPFTEITAEDDVPGDIENVERLKTGAIARYRMEKKYVTKSQGTKPAALYVFRYPEGGAFLHYISIIVPL